MILFLAGTSDARALALSIKDAGYNILTTVVTENAGKEMQKVGLDVYVGRLTNQDFSRLIQDQGFKVVVDASHPFAEEASKNALSSAQEQVSYIRYERESQTFHQPGITMVENYEEAAEVPLKRRASSC